MRGGSEPSGRIGVEHRTKPPRALGRVEQIRPLRPLALVRSTVCQLRAVPACVRPLEVEPIGRHPAPDIQAAGTDPDCLVHSATFAYSTGSVATHAAHALGLGRLVCLLDAA